MDIYIGYETFGIKYVEHLKDDSHMECDGLYDLYGTTISIRTGLPLNRENHIIIHEIIHAIEDQYDIHLTEHQVDCLAIGMYSAMVDNKDLFKNILNGKRSIK